MDETPRQRSGGRAARQAARLHRQLERTPFLTRTLKPFEVLDEEGLALIEHNADTILQEIGHRVPRRSGGRCRCWRRPAPTSQGERVRFPRGLCRQIVQATAPRDFTQHARNPLNNVQIGGTATVFAPVYGSPFVRDLDRGPALRHDRGLPQLREARLHAARSSTIPAAPCASRSTCRSTSATSTWSIPTSATPTSRSWARSRRRARRGHGGDGAPRVRRRLRRRQHRADSA